MGPERIPHHVACTETAIGRPSHTNLVKGSGEDVSCPNCFLRFIFCILDLNKLDLHGSKFRFLSDSDGSLGF